MAEVYQNQEQFGQPNATVLIGRQMYLLNWFLDNGRDLALISRGSSVNVRSSSFSLGVL